MFKFASALVLLATLTLSASSRADSDNLAMTKYMSVSEVPGTYLALAGGAGVIGNKIYKDDDEKPRTDKVYYTTSHSYESSYRAEDVGRILNPTDGRLGNLFEDTTVNKSGSGYAVMMGISTPIKHFNCASTLSFKSFKNGNKTIYQYAFTNFNMAFTDMAIQVEVESVGNTTKVKLYQLAALKGSTYSKLKNYFAIGKFEKAMKENLRKFKDGIGGN